MSNTKIAIALIVAGVLVYLALEWLAKEVQAATLPNANNINQDWINETNP